MLRSSLPLLLSLNLAFATSACLGGGGDESVEDGSGSSAAGDEQDDDGATEADGEDGNGEDGSSEGATDGAGSASDDAADDAAGASQGAGDTSADPGTDDAADPAAATDDSKEDDITAATDLIQPVDDSPPAGALISLGDECDSAADCADEGSTCLTDASDIGRETLAGGMCTVRCETDDTLCGSTGSCGVYGGGTEDTADDVGYCFDTCVYSEPVSKCGDSINRVCILLDPETGAGVCEAKCFSDGECDSGFCDPFYGHCSEERRPGSPDGSPCQVGEDCYGGICFTITEEDEQGICLSECSLHPDTVACHRDLGDTTPVDSACLPPLPFLAYGIDVGPKDLGHCLPTCDVGEGCSIPEWICVPADSEPYEADTGHDGLCLPRVLLTDEALAELDGAEPSDEPNDDEAPSDDEPVDEPSDDVAPSDDEPAEPDDAASEPADAGAR